MGVPECSVLPFWTRVGEASGKLWSLLCCIALGHAAAATLTTTMILRDLAAYRLTRITTQPYSDLSCSFGS